ncbi:hypothetical protein DDR33_06925 [Pararcticibacter amylolyticus]|uniref:HMA domain-containing protein n=2 Tax=Pararcticibacter amylolyticus TaxID=2173175 RepID=A0A2U2PJH3_9SPHI|nr:hypothetical protein DDR33_06925 [Pararcticibacter amylolyticus]
MFMSWFVSKSTIVAVFKTNIGNNNEAEAVLSNLRHMFPDSKVSIDLNDCDKVLRFEIPVTGIGQVMSVVKKSGFNCEVL